MSLKREGLEDDGHCGFLAFSKTNILVNGLSAGYVWCKCGLCQRDPLSPLLFVLVADVLSSMCNCALTYGVLMGVPLVILVECANFNMLMISFSLLPKGSKI